MTLKLWKYFDYTPFVGDLQHAVGTCYNGCGLIAGYNWWEDLVFPMLFPTVKPHSGEKQARKLENRRNSLQGRGLCCKRDSNAGRKKIECGSSVFGTAAL